ncbi:hypothetical protein ACFQ1M_08040 [Sungkyunkwania multivorans]|uniref:DUF4258 domain-containing protein n=1 Tax=Sungkyunkwania multivorans TaxID=1173618 RepID=A0ABW3CZN0_9FLAO
MSFLRRLGFYLGGFSIGLILLAFFLSGKETSCSYGPNARVLKNIGLKEHHYAKEVSALFETNKIDTIDISTILKNGDVDFSRSDTQLDSCKVYLIEGHIKEAPVEVKVTNCDSIATFHSISFLK